jgi:NarL family two-component system response regulator LiaR
MVEAEFSLGMNSSYDERDDQADRLRVIVADDDPLARRMIRDALQRAGMIVVAEGRDGREAVELSLHYRPDVVVMDVVMPAFDGIAATRRIVKEIPDQLVIILTSANEEEMGLLGLRAGAAGFLNKDLDIDVLPRALRGVSEGQAAISRRLGMRLVEQLRRMPEGATGMRPVKSTLTPREWEVIDLLHDGRSTEEIATTLVVATETVRSHIKHILRKLNARSREEAVAAAEGLRSGFAGEPPGGPG